MSYSAERVDGFFKRHPTSTAFRAAPNLSTCRCRRRSTTSWSSTSQHG